MRRISAVLTAALLLVPLASSPAGEGELSGPAEKLLDTAWRMARGSRLREHQEERLREDCAKIDAGEISRIIERLKSREDPPKSLHLVLGVLEREYLGRRFGGEVLEAIPEAMKLLESDAEDDAILLLAASLTLEDLRFARHLAERAASDERTDLRIRAAGALGDLLHYFPEDERIPELLLSLLRDPHAGVRAMACRRAFGGRLDAVFPWAVEHLGDREKVEITWRGERTSPCPGEEALRGLQALTGIGEELTYLDYRLLPPEQQQALADRYSEWWEGSDKTFPAIGSREEKFRRRPSAEKSVIVSAGRATASINLWAGLDRTKIRVALDELEWIAVSRFDFDVNFHLRYMAQGMRADDGEAYRRHFPVGEAFVLARKKIGCYEIVFQALHRSRLKIRLRFYDPLH